MTTSDALTKLAMAIRRMMFLLDSPARTNSLAAKYSRAWSGNFPGAATLKPSLRQRQLDRVARSANLKKGDRVDKARLLGVVVIAVCGQPRPLRENDPAVEKKKRCCRAPAIVGKI